MPTYSTNDQLFGESPFTERSVHFIASAISRLFQSVYYVLILSTQDPNIIIIIV